MKETFRKAAGMMHLTMDQWLWIGAWGIPGIPWILFKIRNHQLHRMYLLACHRRADRDLQATLARKLPWE